MAVNFSCKDLGYRVDVRLLIFSFHSCGDKTSIPYKMKLDVTKQSNHFR